MHPVIGVTHQAAEVPHAMVAVCVGPHHGTATNACDIRPNHATRDQGETCNASMRGRGCLAQTEHKVS